MSKVYLAQHLSQEENIQILLTHGTFVTEEYAALEKAKLVKAPDYRKYIKAASLCGGVLTVANVVSNYSRVASLALSVAAGGICIALLQKRKSKKEAAQIEVISGIFASLKEYFAEKRTKKIDDLCTNITKKAPYNPADARKRVDEAIEAADLNDQTDPLRESAKKIIRLVNPMNKLLPKNIFDRTSWDDLVRECRRYIKPFRDETAYNSLEQRTNRQWSDLLYL